MALWIRGRLRFLTAVGLAVPLLIDPACFANEPSRPQPGNLDTRPIRANGNEEQHEQRCVQVNQGVKVRDSRKRHHENARAQKLIRDRHLAQSPEKHSKKEQPSS